MVTRRQWLKRGASVVIGGATIVVGEPIKAAPVRRDEPLSVTLLGMIFEDVERGSRHEGPFRVRLDFEPDGSFSLTRTAYGGEIDHDDDTDIGEMPPVWHEAGSGRDVIAAIMGARLRD